MNGQREPVEARLGRELARLRAALERHAEAGTEPAEPAEPAEPGPGASDGSGAAPEPAPSALEPEDPLARLVELFGLSEFERDVVLLAAGVELDASFAAAVARARGAAEATRPTFGLALAALPGAHWSAVAPGGPLRFWRLVEPASGSGPTSAPLELDERILHYLVGLDQWDERLTGLVDPLAAPAVDDPSLVPSHRALAERIATAWSRPAATSLPVPSLVGPETAAKPVIAAVAAALLGVGVARLGAEMLPTAPRELADLLRLWDREALLSGSVLLLDCDEVDASDAARWAAVERVVEEPRRPLLLALRERRAPRHRPLAVFEVGKPEEGEQLDLWHRALGPDRAARLDGDDPGGGLRSLASWFDLSVPMLEAAAAEGVAAFETEGGRPAAERSEAEEPSEEAEEAQDDEAAGRLHRALWDACRHQVRPRIDHLAQRIEPAADWEDLVLPERQLDVLHEIALHLRHRARVYGDWGFAAKSSRGLGVSALFAGSSGTGKTMAAEVLARELALDLYHIDLASVVSKYIGETEKNLSRLFDAAEEGGAILLFDEADALFGKRSEVKDSHDRYANLEISYLLQRIESYRGLAVLTTNLKDALDPAFLRRLRFVVEFPFPDARRRLEIWQRIFPRATPTDGLAWERLARLNVAGGHIRSIALHAAFLAADAGTPVTMGLLRRAAVSEFAKLGKTPPESETRDWR